MKYILFLIASLYLGALASLGGGEVGNGGDLDTKSFSAWFARNDRAIQSCVNQDPAFGIDEKVAIEYIQASFSEWNRYIQDKKVLKNSTLMAFANVLNIRKKCLGDEDLVFYLGSETAEITSIKQSFIDPISFAHRTSYDLKNRWGQGKIWVRSSRNDGGFPNWNHSFILQATLLHEWGHVFGNSHMPETVMAEDFMDFVKETAPLINRKYITPEAKAELKSLLLSIDRQKELALCHSCDREYKTETMSGETYRETSKILGRPLQGALQCQLVLKSKYFNIDLICQDEVGKFNWTVQQIPSSLSLQDMHVQSFRRQSLRTDGTRGLWLEYTPGIEGVTSLGVLKTEDGNAYTVFLKLNLETSTRVSLDVVRDDGIVRIFTF